MPISLFLIANFNIMYMYNISYYELQSNIVQAHRNNFLDDLALPVFIRDRFKSLKNMSPVNSEEVDVSGM